MRPTAFTLAAAALTVLFVAACGYPDPNANGGQVASAAQTTPTPVPGADNFNEGAGKTPVKYPDGLQIIDLKTGTGQAVQPGATVDALYTGWLTDGTKFDSTHDRGDQPLCVILTNTQSQSGNCTSVIQGWTEGLPGMKVGGRRKLIIPPGLGYGSQAQGSIPANSTLVFTIQVMSIVAQPTPSPTPSASPSATASPRPSS